MERLKKLKEKERKSLDFGVVGDIVRHLFRLGSTTEGSVEILHFLNAYYVFFSSYILLLEFIVVYQEMKKFEELRKLRRGGVLFLREMINCECFRFDLKKNLQLRAVLQEFVTRDLEQEESLKKTILDLIDDKIQTLDQGGEMVPSQSAPDGMNSVILEEQDEGRIRTQSADPPRPLTFFLPSSPSSSSSASITSPLSSLSPSLSSSLSSSPSLNITSPLPPSSLSPYLLTPPLSPPISSSLSSSSSHSPQSLSPTRFPPSSLSNIKKKNSLKLREIPPLNVERERERERKRERGVVYRFYHRSRVANTLTKISFPVYLSIREAEFLSGKWDDKEEGGKFAPNICRLMSLQHRIDNFVRVEILTSPPEETMAALCFYINVAWELKENSDILNMYVVANALNSTAITRLPNLFSKLPITHAKKWRKLSEYLEPSHNFKALRKITKNSHVPKIPFLNLYLREIGSFLETNKKERDGCFNYWLICRLGERVWQLRKQKEEMLDYLRVMEKHKKSSGLAGLISRFIDDEKKLDIFELSYKRHPRGKKEREEEKKGTDNLMLQSVALDSSADPGALMETYAHFTEFEENLVQIVRDKQGIKEEEKEKGKEKEKVKEKEKEKEEEEEKEEEGKGEKKVVHEKTKAKRAMMTRKRSSSAMLHLRLK